MSKASLLLVLLSVFFRGFLCESCCPEGAWGELTADEDYVDKGIVENITDDLQVYRVGNSSRVIIWNYDIFGFNFGRSRQLADQLAEKGFLVLMPDYYRGKSRATTGVDIKEVSNWENLRNDWENGICPYAKKMGGKVFGAIGTCWGTYMVVKLSAYPEVVAGVHMHPSHTGILKAVGEDEEQTYKELKDSSVQLIMPSGNEPAEVKPGGLASEVLGDRVEFVEFEEMRHGWTTRGNITDPTIEEAVKKAMEKATEFFDRVMVLEK